MWRYKGATLTVDSRNELKNNLVKTKGKLIKLLVKRAH